MLRTRIVGVILAVGVCASVACVESPAGPSHFAPASEVDLVVGTGDLAATGLTVTVHYTGWLYDETKPDNQGARFDTSRDRDPISFIIGSSQVIQGFEFGVAGMRVGGVRRLVIPPSLGYGDSRNGVIPPNATLIFEVELMQVG